MAIVTGAGTGIGQAIAVAFAREGAVAVDYVGDASVAAETMSKIEAIGGKRWPWLRMYRALKKVRD